MDVDDARTLECLESRDCRHQLHAIVGGEGLAALQLLLAVAVKEDRAPAAGAGITGTGAVRVDAALWPRHGSPPPGRGPAPPRPLGGTAPGEKMQADPGA